MNALQRISHHTTTQQSWTPTRSTTSSSCSTRVCPSSQACANPRLVQRFAHTISTVKLTPAAIDEASTQSLVPGDEAPALQRAVYVARAHLALNPPNRSAAEAVLKPFLSLDPAPPSARAAIALSDFIGGEPTAVDEVRDLVIEVEGGDVGEEWEEGCVRALAGTIFVLEKEHEEAIATLNEGQGKEDLEW